MQEITDDIEIFSRLEKAKADRFDPLKQHVAEIYTGTDFLLLLFCPEGKHKGCRLFSVPVGELEKEAESLLLPRLLALPDDDNYASIKHKALLITEKIISEKNGKWLFYDAH